MSIPEQAPNPDNAQKLAELLLSIGKAGCAVYVDIYPVDPQNPYHYQYEYTEVKLK